MRRPSGNKKYIYLGVVVCTVLLILGVKTGWVKITTPSVDTDGTKNSSKAESTLAPAVAPKSSSVKEPEAVVAEDSESLMRRFNDLGDSVGRFALDSVEQGLLRMIRETYPGPILTRQIHGVVVEKDTSGYCGVFYENVPSPRIGLTIKRLLSPTSVEWRSTLSHEMGHFYSPDFQKSLATYTHTPQVHLDSLEAFVPLFRNAYHHRGSFVRSGQSEIAAYYKDLTDGKMSEEEFLDQYLAEAMSCYFEFCNDAKGESLLNKEEVELFGRYLTFIAGSFDRAALFLKRVEMANGLASFLSVVKKDQVQ
ncbi:MAG: hypothetical protein JWN89_283 [Parcubacteria group bacterium]|nr:hypothetical protein [Parcubacteria group bacterium]